MRQVVTAKDIQVYFGKKPSMSFKIINQIKKDLGKLNYQPITISEFCNYYKVEKEGIIEIIKNNEKEKLNIALKKENIENDTQTEIVPVISKKAHNEPYMFSKPTH